VFSRWLSLYGLALWAYPVRVSGGKESKNPPLLPYSFNAARKSPASHTRHSGVMPLPLHV